MVKDKKDMLAIENRDKLATMLNVDIEFIVRDLRQARINGVITEDEYDKYSFYIKQYVHRLGNKIKLQTKETN